MIKELIETAEEKARQTDNFKDAKPHLKGVIVNNYVIQDLAMKLETALEQVEQLKRQIR